MATTIPLIAELPTQQAIFLHHLRTNPNNVTQITGNLVEDNSHMCAVGLGIECFGMIRDYRKAQKEEREASRTGNWTIHLWDVEEEIAKRLQIPAEDVRSIYQLNDEYELSFSKIADVLQEYFLERKRNGSSTYKNRSPEQVYEDFREREMGSVKTSFIKIWEEHQSKVKDSVSAAISSLNAELAKLPVNVAKVYASEDFVYSDPEDSWYDYVDY